MALSDLTLPSGVVTIPNDGGEFKVRGLSFNDISFLYNNYTEVMSGVFDKLAGQEAAGGLDLKSADAVAQAGKTLLTEAPVLAAAIIALAADEPDMIEAALSLPFPVSIDALEKIGRLTFSQEGGLGKVIETVTRMVGGATRLMPARK